MMNFIALSIPFVISTALLIIIPRTIQTQSFKDYYQESINDPSWDQQSRNLSENNQDDEDQQDISDFSLEPFNHERRHEDQTRKHYTHTKNLYKMLFLQRPLEEGCSDSCCQSKRQVRFLQGLQYLLEDSSGRPLYRLQSRHDQVLGNLIFSHGLNQLRKKYVESLQNIKNKSPHEDTISTMEQMILVDKVIEEILQKDNFLGTLINAFSEKHDLSSKVEKHFQCRLQNTSSTTFCQMFHSTENKISFSKLIRGFINTHKLKASDNDQSIEQIYEAAKKSLNRGFPSYLISSSGKEILLKTVKSDPQTVSQNFSYLNQDAFFEPLEEMLQNLEDIKSNITHIRSYRYYSYIDRHKKSELNEVYEHCAISKQKSNACIQRDSLSSLNTENFDQGIFEKRIFSKFDDAYNDAVSLKNSEYLQDVISDTGPEFFSSTTAPKCDLPFCGGRSPYFHSSLNAVSYNARKNICSSLQSPVNRNVGSSVEIEEDDEESLDEQEKRLSNALICSLNQLYPPPPPAMKRIRTLSFMSRKLAKNFHTYGITSDREKAHFLAQIVQETAGLSSVVENVSGRSAWQKVLTDQSSQWNCDAYLNAVENDKAFFDNHYKYSKNSYESAFRGRGLVQLTGCNNYIQFFYHKAALRAVRMDLVELNYKKDIPFYGIDDWGNPEKIGIESCDVDDLKEISRQFERDGLTLEPGSLVNDFEKTLNQLALPCKDRGVPSMSSQEFLVDSSLWYWKKNCRKDYETSIHMSPAKSVSRITQCVHGRVSIYNTFNSSSCNPNGTPKSDLLQQLGKKAWFLESFCHRLKSFKALDDCLGE